MLTLSSTILVVALTIAPLAPGDQVALKRSLFSRQPRELVTDIRGTEAMTADAFVVAHVTKASSTVWRWNVPATETLHVARDVDAAVMAGTRWMWDALQREPPAAFDVYLVPDGRRFGLRSRFPAPDEPLALAFGIRSSGELSREDAAHAVAILGHELWHAFRSRRGQSLIAEEALAHTLQSCLLLHTSGHLPEATRLAVSLPEQMMADFAGESPGAFLRRIEDASASTAGAILSQLNIALLSGNARVASGTPAAENLVDYCGCVAEHAPDFEQRKPAAVWNDSGGTYCSDSR